MQDALARSGPPHSIRRGYVGTAPPPCPRLMFPQLKPWFSVLHSPGLTKSSTVFSPKGTIVLTVVLTDTLCA